MHVYIILCMKAAVDIDFIAHNPLYEQHQYGKNEQKISTYENILHARVWIFFSYKYSTTINY